VSVLVLPCRDVLLIITVGPSPNNGLFNQAQSSGNSHMNTPFVDYGVGGDPAYTYGYAIPATPLTSPSGVQGYSVPHVYDNLPLPHMQMLGGYSDGSTSSIPRSYNDLPGFTGAAGLGLSGVQQMFANSMQPMLNATMQAAQPYHNLSNMGSGNSSANGSFDLGHGAISTVEGNGQTQSSRSNNLHLVTHLDGATDFSNNSHSNDTTPSPNSSGYGYGSTNLTPAMSQVDFFNHDPVLNTSFDSGVGMDEVNVDLKNHNNLGGIDFSGDDFNMNQFNIGDDGLVIPGLNNDGFF